MNPELDPKLPIQRKNIREEVQAILQTMEGSWTAINAILAVTKKNELAYEKIVNTLNEFRMELADLGSHVSGLSDAAEQTSDETRRALLDIRSVNVNTFSEVEKYRKILQGLTNALMSIEDVCNTLNDLTVDIQSNSGALPEQIKALQVLVEKCLVAIKASPSESPTGQLKIVAEVADDLKDIIPNIKNATNEILKDHGYNDKGDKRESFFVGIDKVKTAVVNNIVSLVATAILGWLAVTYANANKEASNAITHKVTSEYETQLKEKEWKIQELNQRLKDLEEKAAKPAVPEQEPKKEGKPDDRKTRR